MTRAEAEVSIVASLKYLVNHFFEMYGIEVSIETQPGTVQLEFITGQMKHSRANPQRACKLSSLVQCDGVMQILHHCAAV